MSWCVCVAAAFKREREISSVTCCIYIHIYGENDGVCPNRNRNWTTHGIRWENFLHEICVWRIQFPFERLTWKRSTRKMSNKTLWCFDLRPDSLSQYKYIPNDYSYTPSYALVVWYFKYVIFIARIHSTTTNIRSGRNRKRSTIDFMVQMLPFLAFSEFTSNKMVDHTVLIWIDLLASSMLTKEKESKSMRIKLAFLSNSFSVFLDLPVYKLYILFDQMSKNTLTSINVSTVQRSHRCTCCFHVTNRLGESYSVEFFFGLRFHWKRSIKLDVLHSMPKRFEEKSNKKCTKKKQNHVPGFSKANPIVKVLREKGWKWRFSRSWDAQKLNILAYHVNLFPCSMTANSDATKSGVFLIKNDYTIE